LKTRESVRLRRFAPERRCGKISEKRAGGKQLGFWIDDGLGCRGLAAVDFTV